jgi:hypothetical protein
MNGRFGPGWFAKIREIRSVFKSEESETKGATTPTPVPQPPVSDFKSRTSGDHPTQAAAPAGKKRSGTPNKITGPAAECRGLFYWS